MCYLSLYAGARTHQRYKYCLCVVFILQHSLSSLLNLNSISPSDSSLSLCALSNPQLSVQGYLSLEKIWENVAKNRLRGEGNHTSRARPHVCVCLGVGEMQLGRFVVLIIEISEKKCMKTAIISLRMNQYFRVFRNNNMWENCYVKKYFAMIEFWQTKPRDILHFVIFWTKCAVLVFKPTKKEPQLDQASFFFFSAHKFCLNS